MLAKKFRLPIQLFFRRTGKSLKSRYFLLKIFSTETAFSRFGVIISSKVSKKAVVRNRLKRLLFNFLKEKQKDLPIADYLFILYPSITEADKKEIISELEKIFALLIIPT